MAKGRIHVIVKEHKSHLPSDSMFAELEALADITEVMKDNKKVNTAFYLASVACVHHNSQRCHCYHTLFNLFIYSPCNAFHSLWVYQGSLSESMIIWSSIIVEKTWGCWLYDVGLWLKIVT